MPLHNFKKGDILTFIATSTHAFAATSGAQAIVVNEIDPMSGQAYMQVKWFRNNLDMGQQDGGYRFSDFRLSTLPELRALLSLLTRDTDVISRAIEAEVAKKPKPGDFVAGDEVYRANGQHCTSPFKVLHRTNTRFVLYRPIAAGGAFSDPGVPYDICNSPENYTRQN